MDGLMDGWLCYLAEWRHLLIGSGHRVLSQGGVGHVGGPGVPSVQEGGPRTFVPVNPNPKAFSPACKHQRREFSFSPHGFYTTTTDSVLSSVVHTASQLSTGGGKVTKYKYFVTVDFSGACTSLQYFVLWWHLIFSLWIYTQIFVLSFLPENYSLFYFS